MACNTIYSQWHVVYNMLMGCNTTPAAAALDRPLCCAKDLLHFHLALPRSPKGRSPGERGRLPLAYLLSTFPARGLCCLSIFTSSTVRSLRVRSSAANSSTLPITVQPGTAAWHRPLQLCTPAGPPPTLWRPWKTQRALVCRAVPRLSRLSVRLETAAGWRCLRSPGRCVLALAFSGRSTGALRSASSCGGQKAIECGLGCALAAGNRALQRSARLANPSCLAAQKGAATSSTRQIA